MNTIMNEQHLHYDIPASEAAQHEYLRAIREHLSDGDFAYAFSLVQHAAAKYPENAYILSYYGCLEAVLEKKFRLGAEKCRKALSLVERKAEYKGIEVEPELYLNLARVYIAAGRRKPALETLEKGLQHDGNGSIQRELRSLGIRREPPFPFLDRSNPLNKYIGMFLYMKRQERHIFDTCSIRES